MMLRVAIIGAGQMARHHVGAIALTGRPYSIVGVHDRIADRANELAALARSRAFPTAEALLEETHPQVVHVCTPPDAHFDAARVALAGGAHVYVEKPFARTVGDARALLDLAHAQQLIVCAGHQLLCDPAFERLTARIPALGTLVQVDSHFAFRPARVSPTSRDAGMLARELLDILPHPLYALVAVLERFGERDQPITLAWCKAEPTEVQAILRSGSLVGRLSVSLRARPVASSLSVIGTGGSFTCDFVRSIITGLGNPGTEALEKILNPMLEGTQLITRTARSLAHRFTGGGSYPGLAESIGAFHGAVLDGKPSPLAPAHLLRVTELFEKLAARVDSAAHPHTSTRRTVPAATGSLTVLTGARGFIGSEIARRLPRVRGIGRDGWPEGLQVHEWQTADLGAPLRPETLAGADVVIHAAAETAGGFKEHQRNTIDATRHLLAAMATAGVRRLILISSLSALTPPRSGRERQDEQTPCASDATHLGPYAWGKACQEALVVREAAVLGIETRIIRPGAIVDWRNPSLPGFVGRRLFGRWHLGLGRTNLPIAACDVERCAEAIAWVVQHFDETPPIVNLFDPAIDTRGRLVDQLREHGWTGRVLWVPIRAITSAVSVGRRAVSLLKRQPHTPLDAWSVLRPRRYDDRVTKRFLESVEAGR